MRSYTLAIIGVVASLSTLTQATQISARSLSTAAVTIDSAIVGKLASQIEDNIMTKLNEYLAQHSSTDSAASDDSRQNVEVDH